MSNQRDGFVVDLSGYKDRASARLEPGDYLVRVTDGELVETKGGDPMVNLFYTVVGGPFDGSPLIDRLVLTDKAMWRLVKVLRALGIKVEKRQMNFQFKNLMGRTLVVTVEDGEPYKGEVKSEIRDYAPSTKPVAAKEIPADVEEELRQETADADASDSELNSAPWEDDGGAHLPPANDNGEVAVPDGGITL